MDAYNFERWMQGSDFGSFPGVARVGTQAHDFSATLLATGESIPLSRYWKERDLVIEFGSLT